jgi:hypothetical protein
MGSQRYGIIVKNTEKAPRLYYACKARTLEGAKRSAADCRNNLGADGTVTIERVRTGFGFGAFRATAEDVALVGRLSASGKRIVWGTKETSND